MPATEQGGKEIRKGASFHFCFYRSLLFSFSSRVVRYTASGGGGESESGRPVKPRFPHGELCGLAPRGTHCPGSLNGRLPWGLSCCKRNSKSETTGGGKGGKGGREGFCGSHGDAAGPVRRTADVGRRRMQSPVKDLCRVFWRVCADESVCCCEFLALRYAAPLPLSPSADYLSGQSSLSRPLIRLSRCLP